MAHQNNCHNCGQSFTGNSNKRFCTDACRKAYSRHGGVPLAAQTNNKNPDKSGQGRTSARPATTNLGNYALKKGIDVIAKYTEHTLLPPKTSVLTTPPAPDRPLQLQTAHAILNDTLTDMFRTYLQLDADWQAFLGSICYPFKMLVWGVAGSGKSSFCLRLANQIARSKRLLYVAGEEELTSYTLRDKQQRMLTPATVKNCIFLNRLPQGASEWQQTMRAIQLGTGPSCKAVFYDSVTQLNITPFYVHSVAHEFALPGFTDLAHIFITHAHKDGQQYRGDGSWGHEVDVIVRVEGGVAVTQKNRFGEVGRSLNVF